MEKDNLEALGVDGRTKFRCTFEK